MTNLGSGEIVLEGGPYDTPNHTYNETLVITEDGCYDFTIFDAGGNGLSGSGIYGLKAGNTNLFTGRIFGNSESNEFYYEVTDDVEENFNHSISIYPNPTSGLLNIFSQEKQTVTIYNLMGQCVFEGLCNGKPQIDMKAYGVGIYAVRIGNETQRIVVK